MIINLLSGFGVMFLLLLVVSTTLTLLGKDPTKKQLKMILDNTISTQEAVNDLIEAVDDLSDKLEDTSKDHESNDKE
jgi:hypothetical protein